MLGGNALDGGGDDLAGAHVAFGAGVHACIGQMIARLEAEAVLKALARRASHIELDGAPVQRINNCLRSFKSLPRARAAALSSMASAVVADPRIFGIRRSLEEAIAQLRELPGVGEWTAQYIAMRGLHESDAFLAADIGVQRAMAIDGVRPTAKAVLAHAEQWRPWRGYAVLHLWTSE